MIENGGRGEEMAGGVSRRTFLRVGGLGAMSASVALGQAYQPKQRSVIHLMMVGGPSQLETFDPKPDAPEGIRGPFQSIATAIPGVRINEHLPEIARRMGRLTLVRSLHHNEAPIHETGLQLLQTGRISRYEEQAPHFGSVAARLLGSRDGVPPFAVLPGLIGPTGMSIYQGQQAGKLGARFNPVTGPGVDASSQLQSLIDLRSERKNTVVAYGASAFGQHCLQARKLVEAGSKVVTVNMAESVFNKVSWDCHGSRPFSTFDDYARDLLPSFDRAFSALVDDLDQRGLLETTLVVASGEFGRDPRINARGGRDHWTGVWSALMAGGGFGRGQVIGASDKHGAEPIDRPVHAAELVATIYRWLGIDPTSQITLEDGSKQRLIDETVAGRELLA